MSDLPELPTPLHREPLTRVLARVAYRLILRDYRSHPENYDTPSQGILDLAQNLHLAGFTSFYSNLLSAAKWTASGWTLMEWRNILAAHRSVRPLRPARLPRKPDR